MAEPLFVIGLNRSGTKWLSNLILNHSQVAGVASQDHFGILETNLLTTLPEMFGPITTLDSRVGLIECFAATDYFRRTGLCKMDLYRIQPRDYYSFFGQLMDRLAESRGTSWWLQKFSPVSLPGLIRHFPRARFVCILRNPLDTVRSSLKLAAASRPKRNSLKYLFWYGYGVKRMKSYRNMPGVSYVRYEDLKADPEKTLRGVCHHLELAYETAMLETPYRPNTSFSSSTQRRKLLSRSDEIWIWVWSWIVQMIPLSVFSVVARLQNRIKVHRQPFVRQMFSETVRELGLVQPDDNYFSNPD